MGRIVTSGAPQFGAATLQPGGFSVPFTFRSRPVKPILVTLAVARFLKLCVPAAAGLCGLSGICVDACPSAVSCRPFPVSARSAAETDGVSFNSAVASRSAVLCCYSAGGCCFTTSPTA